MDTDDPTSQLGLLPRFTQPPTRPAVPSLPPATAPATNRLHHPGEGSGSGSLAGHGTQKPGHDPTPTATSSAGAGKPSKAETAGLVAGLLGLVVIGAAWAVRLRTHRKLRRPTRTQLDDAAAPLARIMLRHADLDWLNADLTDLIAAGAATGAYLSDGPLLEGPATDPGQIPDEPEEQP